MMNYQYMCSICKIKVNATKQWRMASQPYYLLLRINRFDNNANKITTHVQIDK